MKPKLWRKRVRNLIKTDTNVGSDISRLIVSYVTYSKYNEKLYRGIIPKEIPYSAIECDWFTVAALVCCRVSPKWQFCSPSKVLSIENCCQGKNPILCVHFACDICNESHDRWCKPNWIVFDGVVYLTIKIHHNRSDIFPTFTVMIL